MKEPKESKLLLIDGEALLHRAFHKFEKFKSTDGIPSGAIYGFMKSLSAYVFRFDPTHLLITFDNGKSKYRTEILPGYKEHRKSIAMDYESFWRQKRTIMRILRCMGIPYIFDKDFRNNYEADDYIAWVCHTYPDKVLIISSDKDFNQLLSNRVKIFNPSKDKLVTMVNCKEEFGYSSQQTVDYLSLVGDSSDDIPGYRGIGPKKAVEFLDKYGSIFNMLSKWDQLDIKLDRDTLQEVYSINMRMIDLKWFIKTHRLTEKEIPQTIHKKNKEKLRKLFIKYSFNSFLTEEFEKPFKKIKIWRIGEE